MRFKSLRILISFVTIFVAIHVQGKKEDIYWGNIRNQSHLENNDLTRPAGAYKKLLEWKLPQMEKEDIFQCLIYRVPFPGKEMGRMMIQSFYKEGCVLGSHFHEKILFDKRPNDLTLKTFSDYSGFHLQFISEDLTYIMTFPQAGKNKRWKSLKFNWEDQKVKEVSLKKGDYCLKWNKHCEEEVNECSHCPSGQWRETLNYKECPSKVTGICGPRECGGKNQKACLRMVSLKYPISCEEALEFVTCAPLLIPNCEGTGEIICR